MHLQFWDRSMTHTVFLALLVHATFTALSFRVISDGIPSIFVCASFSWETTSTAVSQRLLTSLFCMIDIV